MYICVCMLSTVGTSVLKCSKRRRRKKEGSLTFLLSLALVTYNMVFPQSATKKQASHTLRQSHENNCTANRHQNTQEMVKDLNVKHPMNLLHRVSNVCNRSTYRQGHFAASMSDNLQKPREHILNCVNPHVYCN